MRRLLAQLFLMFVVLAIPCSAQAATLTTISPEEDGLAKDIPISATGTDLEMVVDWVSIGPEETGSTTIFDVEQASDGSIYVSGYYTNTTFGGVSYSTAGSAEVFFAKYSSSGEFQWVKTGSSTAYDVARAILPLSDGSVIVVADYGADFTFDGTTYSLVGTRDGLIAKYSSSGEQQWVKIITGPSAVYLLYDTEVLADGNIIIAGKANNGTYDGEAITVGANTSAILLKVDANDGSYIWHVADGVDDDSFFYEVQVDADGNIYAGGAFQDNATFGSTSLTGTSHDYVVAKYNNLGQNIWATSGGSTAYEYVHSLEVSQSGTIYVASFFSGSGTFNQVGSATTLDYTSTGATDFVVISYNTDGSLNWGVQYGGANDQTATKVALNSEQDLILSGYFYQQMDVNSQTITVVGDNTEADMFVLSLDSADGSFNWFESYGATGSDFLNDLSLDSQNNITAAGTVTGTIDFGTESFTTDGGSYEGVLLKLTAPDLRVGNTTCGTAYLHDTSTYSCIIDAQYQAGQYPVSIQQADGSFASTGLTFTLLNFSAPSGSTSPARPQSCTASAPNGQIELYEIKRTGSDAELFFTPLASGVSEYHVVYGYEEGDERFGGLRLATSDVDQSGAQKVTIKDLDPHQTYVFQVISMNSCAFGSRSNWLKTRGSGANNLIQSFLY